MSRPLKPEPEPKTADTTSPKFRAVVGALYGVLQSSTAPMAKRVDAITIVWETRAYGATEAPVDETTRALVAEIESVFVGLSRIEALMASAEVMDSPTVAYHQAKKGETP